MLWSRRVLLFGCVVLFTYLNISQPDKENTEPPRSSYPHAVLSLLKHLHGAHGSPRGLDINDSSDTEDAIDLTLVHEPHRTVVDLDLIHHHDHHESAGGASHNSNTHSRGDASHGSSSSAVDTDFSKADGGSSSSAIEEGEPAGSSAGSAAEGDMKTAPVFTIHGSETHNDRGRAAPAPDGGKSGSQGDSSDSDSRNSSSQGDTSGSQGDTSGSGSQGDTSGSGSQGDVSGSQGDTSGSGSQGDTSGSQGDESGSQSASTDSSAGTDKLNQSRIDDDGVGSNENYDEGGMANATLVRVQEYDEALAELLGSPKPLVSYDPRKVWYWGGTLRETMLKLLVASARNAGEGECRLNLLEEAYWSSRNGSDAIGNETFVAITTATSQGHADVVAGSSFTTCLISVTRNINVDKLYTPDTISDDVLQFKKNLSESYPLAIRPLGTVCPSELQMKQALGVLSKDLSWKSDFINLLLKAHPLIMGDSIANGVGVTKEQRWHAIFRGQLEKVTGVKANWTVPCIAAKSGFSLKKLHFRAVKKPKYFMTPDPVVQMKLCLKTRPEVLIFAMGTNDYVENTSLNEFVSYMEWFVKWSVHRTKGGIRAVVVLTPLIPPIGKKYLSHTEHSWHGEVLARLRVSVKRLKTLHSLEYALLADVDTAVRWCAEHNYVDGVHPNGRGHLLMALELLRATRAADTFTL